MILCAVSKLGCRACNHPERTQNVSTCPVYQETRICLFTRNGTSGRSLAAALMKNVRKSTVLPAPPIPIRDLRGGL